MKKLVAILGAITLCIGTVFMAVGCGGKKSSADLTIAYLSGGRGETYVEKLVEGFEKTPAVKDYLKKEGKDALEVKILKDPGSAVEDTVLNSINTGVTPDVLILNYNMIKKTTEGFVRNKKLVDLTSLLDEKVAGEEVALKDKLVPGLLDNYAIQPYGDGKVYTLPAYYSPTGLWYDASRFEDNGKDNEYACVIGDKYELPHTWAEFWALGDYLNGKNSNNTKVTAETPSLFTYPTAGYFDGFIFSAIASFAGEEKFMKTLGYTDGIWNDADVQKAMEAVVKLRDYMEPNTVAQANNEGFTENQQAIIGKADGSAKGTALFIPNGDWLPGEMSKSTPEGFTWGFTPLPAKDKTSPAYVNTFIENIYLHKDGANLDLGKQFLLYYFSNEGAKIVAQANKSIVPTKDALANAEANGVPKATADLYKVYDGNLAVSGSFVATKDVTGVAWTDVLYNDLTDKVFNKANDSKSVAELLKEWTDRVEKASDQMRDKIVK